VCASVTAQPLGPKICPDGNPEYKGKKEEKKLHMMWIEIAAHHNLVVAGGVTVGNRWVQKFPGLIWALEMKL